MSFAFETPRSGAAALFALHVAQTLPMLTTRRLLLRSPRVADFESFAEIACAPRGTPLGGPMSREEAWAGFSRLMSGWTLHDQGLWTIGHAGAIAGFVLLGYTPGSETPELAVLLGEELEGQGIGFEAAVAARAYAFDTLGWPTLVSRVAPGNTRAQALARRLGAAQVGDANGASLWCQARAEAAA